jgi:hypothetical protein
MQGLIERELAARTQMQAEQRDEAQASK